MTETTAAPGPRRWPHAIDYHFANLLRRLGGAWFPSLVALAILALALGCWGYHEFAVQNRKVPSATITLYRSLQLFALEMPETETEYPLALDVARFLAAFVSFSAVLGVLGTIFEARVQAARLWVLGRHHVVLCGLGEKGAELVQVLRKDRHFVVVIEPDATHEDLSRCRALGAVVLTGNPTDSWRLKKARVHRADVLMAIVPGDDRLNVETAILAHAICRSPRHGTLTCVLQVSDPDLTTVVRKHPMATEGGDGFDLQPFRIDDACAQAMLREALVGGRVQVPGGSWSSASVREPGWARG